MYRGWRRTPLCILTGDGAAEFFATTHDVYLVLNQVAEDPTDHDTADGKPATRAAAHRRLAHMMLHDLETSTPQERERLAARLSLRLELKIADGVKEVISHLPAPVQVISSGSGEFLIPMLFRSPAPPLPGPALSLAQQFGADVSAVACAYAVAVLCAEQEG